jgi:class 3 adenylate cyclase
LLTFIFTDIEGSTRLVQEVGTDRYGDLQAQHSRLLRGAVAEHGGQEFGTEGDAHFFVFRGAASAVRAAVQAQRWLAAYRWPPEAAIRVRMGLHTGEPAVRDGDYVGVELNRVARITAAGHGGQILVSQVTRDGAKPDLPEIGFTDLGLHRLKDLLDPVRIYQVQADGLGQSFPAIRTIDTRPRRLPAQLTSFIGREQEIREVAELLERDRLVTLAGPGGSGKTRLAVLVADRLLPRFDDGVFFVPLAPVRDAAMVPSTIAGVLGVKEGPDLPVVVALEEYLRDHRLLLVLDNFEHLLPAASVVSRLLGAAPQVKVLATSRTVLCVYGEREYVVAPCPSQGRTRPWQRRWNATRRSSCSWIVRPWPGPGSACRPTAPQPWPRSAGGWTGCPWRSSWRRPASGSCRPVTYRTPRPPLGVAGSRSRPS